MPIVDLTSHICQQEGNFMSVPVCAGECAHVCIRLWRPKVNLQGGSSGIIHPPHFFFAISSLTSLEPIKWARL